MSHEMIGVLTIILLFVLLFLRVPIAYALAFSGFVGYVAIAGMKPALSTVGLIPYAKMASYTFTVAPLFLLMGHFAYHAGLAQDLMEMARAWVGRMTGGLVQATIFAATALGAVSGSGMASCAILSKVTIPEMLRAGVDRKLAYGVVASGGTLASMIPPSVLMVIYGVIAEQDIGKLLIAGILPGIITALIYMIMVYIRVKKNPSLSPVIEAMSMKQRVKATGRAWGALLIAVVIMGGIYAGIFTATEAGAIGAFAAFLLAARRLRWPQLRECLYETMKTTSMIFLLVACAFIFGYLTSISRLPVRASEFITGLPSWGLIGGVVVLYLVLGCFIDMIAVLFITLPIILPAMHTFGFNLIWFGVIVVNLCEIALLTPPFGLNLFIIKSVVPQSKLSEVIAGIWPFVFANLVALIVFILFPQITLFLPGKMSK